MPESVSISSIRRLMRFPSEVIISEKRSVSSGEACFIADRLESITVSGERSSWEAEAINSVCFWWLMIRGLIMCQVNSQKKIPSRKIPKISALANNRRRCQMLRSRFFKGRITATLRTPVFLGIRAVEA